MNSKLVRKMMEKVEDDEGRLLSLDDFRGFDTEGWSSLDFLISTTGVASDIFEQEKQQTRRMKQVITPEPMMERGKAKMVKRETVGIKPTRECLTPIKRVRVVFGGEVPESSRAVKKPRKDGTREGIDFRLGPNRDVPLNIKEYIDSMVGKNIQLVCQKPLTESDVKKNQNRLLMPHPIIVSPSFLREDERELLKSRVGVHMSELRVPLLEPALGTCEVSLRSWAMSKGEGKSSTVYYVLAGGWYGVVVRNGLKSGDIVQLWSFRVDSKLCLALVVAHNI